MTDHHHHHTPIPQIRTGNIRSLSDFRRDATAHLARLAESGEVEVLTVNGEARGVVMAPATFDRLADLAFQAEVAEGIRRGMEEIDRGEGMDARESIRQLAAELGVSIQR